MGVWGVDRILEGLLALLAFLECARLEGFASRALWWLTALRALRASASQKGINGLDCVPRSVDLYTRS